jgi:hypothetical protein
MTIGLEKLDAILAQEDVEGFIAAGAPLDEYHDEAAQIIAAIGVMEPASVTSESVLATLSYIWMRSFGLSTEDMALRLPALKQIAGQILHP